MFSKIQTTKSTENFSDTVDKDTIQCYIQILLTEHRWVDRDSNLFLSALLS